MALDISKIKNSLSVLILCGGEGQRLRPLTKKIPKPLVRIKDKSILEYIINHLLDYNIKNIYIASGYKHTVVKNFIQKKYKNKNIKVINTGLKTKINQRVHKCAKHFKENIILCYGDTLLDINLNKLIQYYLKDTTKFIISSYELKSSFGILYTKKNNIVKKFKEKPNLGLWFNVGYFLFSFKYLEYLSKFKDFESFLVYLSKKNKMKTFKHTGKHITVNTISELENAKLQINKFK
tara:strand:- start:883 stop:1590 length:708 start_codon:yes stop_codon:yes gene_type:complete